jgi:hypothetical protein
MKNASSTVSALTETEKTETNKQTWYDHLSSLVIIIHIEVELLPCNCLVKVVHHIACSCNKTLCDYESTILANTSHKVLRRPSPKP